MEWNEWLSTRKAKSKDLAIEMLQTIEQCHYYFQCMDFDLLFLENANLKGSYFFMCNFHKATFENVNFSNGRLRHCNFFGAKFIKCNFENVEFDNTILTYTECKSCNFINATFEGVSFKQAIIERP